MPDLLLELFSEEIPARMQARAAQDLRRLVTDGLVEAGLTYAHATAHATPRRLALAIQGLSAESPTRKEERKGPRVDAPERALAGFLRATGLTREDLEARETPKGQVWFATITHPGRPAAEIVAETVERVIRAFPWPKSMRWGSGTLRWVRPLHSILCILSDEGGTRVVELDIDGIRAGASTRGHRFMAPDAFEVSGFEDYAEKLARARVILSAEDRAAQIRAEAESLAFARGREVVEDPGLLAEVAGLVEWPVVLMGDIAPDFLHLPAEVLQTSMREHQKFFSVRNPATGRIEGFVTVANRETADQGATILAGNSKVLSARLSDARFFWDNDLRVARAGGEAWLRALDQVTFHNRLGTQGARIGRIAALARDLAASVGADADVAEQAARWAKADLSSEMVYEFPELQGTMGRYYALEAGKPVEVADAARDHYAPLGPSDDVPTAPVSVAVALADKLDMLTGFWAIGEKPTGSKDPFALRRAALGVIRIVLANGLRLSLSHHIQTQLLRHEIAQAPADASTAQLDALDDLLRAIATHGIFGAAWRAVTRASGAAALEPVGDLQNRLPGVSADLLSFVHDRLKVHLREEGMRHDVIDACLAMPGADDLTLLVARARALGAVLATEDGENLLQGFKRANNILTQAEERDGVEYSFGADVKFAEAEAERALFAALDEAEARISPALEAEDFGAAMSAMAALRGPIDAFFEEVQINSDNEILRRNRLNLLSRIRDICLSVADLRRVEG